MPQPDGHRRPVRGIGKQRRLLGLIAWHRDLAIGLLVSVLVHAGLFIWKPGPPTPPARVDLPAPTLELAAMPVIEPEQPDLSIVENLHPQSTPQSNLAPPSRDDFLQLVPINAFVQPIQPPVPLGAKIVATAKIFQGGWGTSEQYQIFDPSMLDKQVMPTMQMRPDYPEALRRQGIEGSADVEFVVDTTGRVRDVRCLSATAPDFCLSAVYGVQRWRYRPGEKAGRPVNTRIRQLINFTLYKMNR